MEEENIFNEIDTLDILVDGNVDVLDAFIRQYGINLSMRTTEEFWLSVF